MTAVTPVVAGDTTPSASPGALVLRRVLRNPLGLAGLVILGVIVVCAIFAPWLAPFSPDDVLVGDPLSPPSAAHWFGTDEIGRDILSRTIYGSRVSLQIVVLAIAGAIVAGSAIGLLSGWLGGRWDAVIMRVMDGLLAFPLLVLALAIIAILGPDLVNAMIAIAVTKTPGFARLVRGEVLRLRSIEYVKAAEAIGGSDARIIFRHIWPNVMGNVIVYGSLSGSQALINESALSFLGLGVQPPTPSWGYMVATGMQYWQSWWMSFFPGLAIFLAILAFNFVGDALRDALDSRLGR
jgi:peptide/nickel transport system permease protein